MESETSGIVEKSEDKTELSECITNERISTREPEIDLIEEKLPNPQSTEAPAAPQAPENEKIQYFKIKKIRYGPKEHPIVTQNVNGPCPLIALINALVLKRKVTVPNFYAIKSTDLLNLLSESIFSHAPPEDDAEKENFEKNVESAMKIMDKLVTGLDINIKFSAVTEFESTDALSLFNLVQVKLYHVWLPDPQFAVLYDLISGLNYEEMMLKMIGDEASDEKLLLHTFHEDTSSQITFHGLSSLLGTMEDGEIAVLFHNNHFSTVLKRRDELLRLVSDEGYANEPRVIWETLNSCDGDTFFVDCDFANFKPINPEFTAPSQISDPFEFVDPSAIEVGVEAIESPKMPPSAQCVQQHTPATSPNSARTAKQQVTQTPSQEPPIAHNNGGGANGHGGGGGSGSSKCLVM